MKLAMERSVAVVLSVSYSKHTALEAQYTQKRFNEAQILLAQKGSAQGMSYLSEQVKTTKQAINNSKDAKSKAEISQAYVDALNDVYNQLEQDKQDLAYTPSMPTVPQEESTPPVQTGSARTLPRKVVTPAVKPNQSSGPAPPAPPTVQTVYVTVQIIQTQQIIQQTIKDLNQNSQNPSPTPTPTQPSSQNSSPGPTPTHRPIPTPTPTTEPDLRLRAAAPGDNGVGLSGLSNPNSGASPTDTPVPTVPPATSTPVPPTEPTDSPVPTP
jgi:uncharacterized phage infection (PIP) family protein YhgE